MILKIAKMIAELHKAEQVETPAKTLRNPRIYHRKAANYNFSAHLFRLSKHHVFICLHNMLAVCVPQIGKFRQIPQPWVRFFFVTSIPLFSHPITREEREKDSVNYCL